MLLRLLSVITPEKPALAAAERVEGQGHCLKGTILVNNLPKGCDYIGGRPSHDKGRLPRLINFDNIFDGTSSQPQLGNADFIFELKVAAGARLGH